ncbi:MAG TPA: NADH-quinone oxidoreductase subunit J [Cyclobacteriaceae bacterium]|nr:NADH-quinone oxidoreductase subunit J [Cyclobacteriaceae bacterium]
MSAITFIFYAFEILAAISAVAILFVKNVFYGALLLIVCLLSIAGIYVISNAEFIAVTQILIYAGGVLVLIIFGVMLTTRISGKPLVVKNDHWLAGILVGLSFLTGLMVLFSSVSFYSNNQTPTDLHYTKLNKIGILLMTDYVFPFEVAGVLLLAALLGAAVVASSFNSTKKL